jgi:UDP-N-acetylglucosamine--N-acetylmuramyl-(pentapeptide) pyrophosphoryl-undecaprenol N-acetylglucosamine transferase
MKSQEHPTIVLTGGGSGGHIIPLLSLAHELKALDPDCQIVYIGHKGDNFDTLKLSSQDFDFLSFINAGKFRRYHSESFWSQLADFKTILLNIRDFFRVLKSTGAAYRILNRIKADAVFAKGGFVSVPVGLAARLKGLPIITHDSDAVGGLANRLLSRWATVRTTGMPGGGSKVKYVGIPVDDSVKHVSLKEQQAFKKMIGLPSDSQVILVAGGGLGSKNINDLMVKVAPRLLQSNLALHIVHLTGRQHETAVKKAYREHLDSAQLERVDCQGFTPEFFKYSGAADLIISRAGATAIAEYALQAKACIIIPSPFLTGGHQLKNAEELAKRDAATIVDDSVAEDEMIGVINQLLANDHRRWQLAENIHKLAQPGAGKELAAIVYEQTKKHA